MTGYVTSQSVVFIASLKVKYEIFFLELVNCTSSVSLSQDGVCLLESGRGSSLELCRSLSPRPMLKFVSLSQVGVYLLELGRSQILKMTRSILFEMGRNALLALDRSPSLTHSARSGSKPLELLTELQFFKKMEHLSLLAGPLIEHVPHIPQNGLLAHRASFDISCTPRLDGIAQLPSQARRRQTPTRDFRYT